MRQQTVCLSVKFKQKKGHTKSKNNSTIVISFLTFTTNPRSIIDDKKQREKTRPTRRASLNKQSSDKLFAPFDKVRRIVSEACGLVLVCELDLCLSSSGQVSLLASQNPPTHERTVRAQLARELSIRVECKTKTE